MDGRLLVAPPSHPIPPHLCPSSAFNAYHTANNGQNAVAGDLLVFRALTLLGAVAESGERQVTATRVGEQNTAYHVTRTMQVGSRRSVAERSAPES